MQVTREYAEKYLSTDERWKIYFSSEEDRTHACARFWAYTEENVWISKDAKMRPEDYRHDLQLLNFYNYLHDRCIKNPKYRPN